jgi:hypothetical protein
MIAKAVVFQWGVPNKAGLGTPVRLNSMVSSSRKSVVNVALEFD